MSIVDITMYGRTNVCAPWKSLYYERAHTRVRPYTVKEASLSTTFALTENFPLRRGALS